MNNIIGAVMDNNSIRLKVFRFDPASDKKSYFQEYEIQYEEHMSVLAAIKYIYEKVDGTLSINGYLCYRKLCGLCMLKINGKNALSCRTLVKNDMMIEPAENHPVIKDLVVDFLSQNEP